MIYAICAAVVGFLQCLLLRSCTLRATKIKTGSVIPFIVMKVLLYAAGIAGSVFLFREQLLYIGIGYAAGMTLTLAVLLIIANRKDGGERHDADDD